MLFRSEAANKFIVEFESGKLHLGSLKKQPVTQKPKKRNNQSLLLLIPIALCYYWFFIMGTYPTEGFALNDNQKLLKNHQIVFYNTVTKRKYTCNTDNEANFNIRLPKGQYKVFGIGNDVRPENQNENSSLINLNVSCQSRYRITVRY